MYSSVEINHDLINSPLINKKKFEFLINFNKILIQKIAYILSLFSEMFDLLESNKPTLHLVVPVYFTIRNHLESFSRIDEVSELSLSLLTFLENTYRDSVLLFHITATFLCPFFKSFNFC